MLSIQVFVDFGKVKYVRNINSNITYRPTFRNSNIDFRLTLRGYTNLNIHYKPSNETIAFFHAITDDKYRNEIMQEIRIFSAVQKVRALPKD